MLPNLSEFYGGPQKLNHRKELPPPISVRMSEPTTNNGKRWSSQAMFHEGHVGNGYHSLVSFLFP